MRDRQTDSVQGIGEPDPGRTGRGALRGHPSPSSPADLWGLGSNPHGYVCSTPGVLHHPPGLPGQSGGAVVLTPHWGQSHWAGSAQPCAPMSWLSCPMAWPQLALTGHQEAGPWLRPQTRGRVVGPGRPRPSGGRGGPAGTRGRRGPSSTLPPDKASGLGLGPGAGLRSHGRMGRLCPATAWTGPCPGGTETPKLGPRSARLPSSGQQPRAPRFAQRPALGQGRSSLEPHGACDSTPHSAEWAPPGICPSRPSPWHQSPTTCPSPAPIFT